MYWWRHLVERKGGAGMSNMEERIFWIIFLALLLKLLSPSL